MTPVDSNPQQQNGDSQGIDSQRISDENRARLVKTDFSVPSIRLPRFPESSSSSAENNSLRSGYMGVKALLHRRLLQELESKRLLNSEESLIVQYIQDFANRVLSTEELALNHYERRILADDLIQETLGVGPLASLMKDPSITDILVNNHESVYVERYGKLEKTPVRFNDEAHLIRIIQRLVARMGRRIDESSPMVDARLADGSRINATLPPISVNGPTLSIRRFSQIFYSFEKLEEMGMFSREMGIFLRSCVRSRMNILVSGGGGAGKSTLVSALAQMIPDSERLITIEDAVELQIRRDNLVRLETRSRNTEGAGEVTTRELLVNSLRMRPDRIIVGEVRGAEALDMLQAMNTGHEGSMTTVHANGPKDALTRLETMVLLAGTELPSRAIREQINSAIHVVLHVRRDEDGKRRIVSIGSLERLDDAQFHIQELFRFQYVGKNQNQILGQFQACGQIPPFMDILQLHTPELNSSIFQTFSQVVQ
ncbi:MAG: CpaF family protein [Candidatus Sumerlaeia bacterium]|nr:CpaF family protein [Candidatus Sumerlaeia bacterium]